MTRVAEFSFVGKLFLECFFELQYPEIYLLSGKNMEHKWNTFTFIQKSTTSKVGTPTSTNIILIVEVFNTSSLTFFGLNRLNLFIKQASSDVRPQLWLRSADLVHASRHFLTSPFIRAQPCQTYCLRREITERKETPSGKQISISINMISAGKHTTMSFIILWLRDLHSQWAWSS